MEALAPRRLRETISAFLASCLPAGGKHRAMNPSRLAKSAIAVAVLIASLVFAGTVLAAGAPSAVTGSATAVSTNKATLNGSVNPNGMPTSWYFEWGATTAYGNKTTPQTLNGTSSKSVSVTLSNLTPGGTMHYR